MYPVVARVLANAQRVRFDNVSWAVERLLRKTMPELERAVDYTDERARPVVDALVLNLFLFLEHCMSMTKGHDPAVGYLFEDGDKRVRQQKAAGAGPPGQKQDVRDHFEKALQLHCLHFLNIGLLAGKVEISDISAGRADILVSSGKVNLVVEVKREDTNASFDHLRSVYGAQATEYSNVNVRISFLLVLDKTRTDGTGGDINEKVHVTAVTKPGDEEPRTLLIITVPGRRKRPSNLKL